jgi:hypothetical protein
VEASDHGVAQVALVVGVPPPGSGCSLLSTKLPYRPVSPFASMPDWEGIVEVEHILLEFGLILGAGLLSQLAATLLRVPEMIVLVAVGALIGPSVLGVASNPLDGAGAQLIFTMGVSLILFHGAVAVGSGCARQDGSIGQGHSAE